MYSETLEKHRAKLQFSKFQKTIFFYDTFLANKFITPNDASIDVSFVTFAFNERKTDLFVARITNYS